MERDGFDGSSVTPTLLDDVNIVEYPLHRLISDFGWDNVARDYPEWFENQQPEENSLHNINTEGDSESSEDDKDSVASGGTSSDEEWGTYRQKLMDFNSKVENTVYNMVEDGDPSVDSESDNSKKYLESPISSDDDDEVSNSMKECVIYKVVDDYAGLKKFGWRVGMKFASQDLFKEQVKLYAAVCGYNISWLKSEKNKRQAAKCTEGCTWKIYASWDGNKESFSIKSVNSRHTCIRKDYKNTQVKPLWLAKQYLEQYKKHPNWSRKLLAESVMERFGVHLDRSSCYKVRDHAYRMLYGTMEDHYNKVASYIHELNRVDPQTSVVLLTDKPKIPREPDIFKRLYISYTGLREGFMRGCRPLICLDGCFLKTFLGGMLLSAIGRDGNNQMYPIAWAVVEAENNDSWSWFLQNLKVDLGGFGGANCTISSDQQKGLCNAVKQHFPNVEHRNCARHIFANWHKKHKGDELKMLFWRAARAYTRADFDQALDEMGKVSKKAVEDFLLKNPTYFCRSFLKTGSKCDVIVNNLAETFNGFILEARAKSLIFMLEDIRLKVMERIYAKRGLMSNAFDDICPRIRRKLDAEKDEARKCVSMSASIAKFQVMYKGEMYSVNLDEKTCTCRKWDLGGIPCCHAVSCCNRIRLVSPEDLVLNWFKKETYLEAYSKHIEPLNGDRHWKKVNYTLMPPEIKAKVGRPPKNRRKDPHERYDKKGKLTKHGIQMTCTHCKGKNHNKRTCSQKDMPPSSEATPHQVRPRGRPRKDGEPPRPRTESPINNSNQSKRPRGRPKRAPSTTSNEPRIPAGRGVFFADNNTFYINPGSSASIQSQSSTVFAPSQASQL